MKSLKLIIFKQTIDKKIDLIIEQIYTYIHQLVYLFDHTIVYLCVDDLCYC